MTRDEILNLKVGDIMEWTMDTVPFSGGTRLKEDARYHWPRPVQEISYRGVNQAGEVYVGGYLTTGPGSAISFSISENELYHRLVTP